MFGGNQEDTLWIDFALIFHIVYLIQYCYNYNYDN